MNDLCISQLQLRPAPPPRAIAGHLQILRCPGTGHLPTPGLFPSFWHARSLLPEYNYIEDITGKKSRLAHLSRTDLMHAFLRCLSRQNCIAKLESYRRESTFFGYWIKISVDIIWRTSFHIYNLFITITLQRSINFNVNNSISIIKP